MNTITLLHLSDLQFGQKHRYPDGDASFNNLYEKLAGHVLLPRAGG